MTGQPPNRRDGRDRTRREARGLALAFVLYGLVATGFLAINMPPFQNPDELAHFMRAAQIADGGLVGVRFWMTEADGTPNLTAGGRVDPAAVAMYYRFLPVGLAIEQRATRAMWTPPFYWTATRVLEIFPNTVMYPPVFYIPSAIGILTGRAAGMTVTQTLMISRLLTGVVSVATGAVAIIWAGATAPFVFMVLTLPMSLSLIASPSQDALLLTCGALAGALLERMLRCRTEKNGKLLVGLTIALGLVAMARPPCFPLAMLPLGLPMVRPRWRIAAMLAVLACVTVWSGIVWSNVLTNFGKVVGADPPAQIARLLADPWADPWRIGSVAWATLASQWRTYLSEFVGNLGWLNTALPMHYHIAARAMLGLAALAAMFGGTGERVGVRPRLVISLASLLAVAVVFGTQFVSWTPPGAAAVEGVQGRYFLPIAVVGASLLPVRGFEWYSRFRGPVLVAVACFPVITLAVVMRTVLLRYYLG